VAGVDEQDVFDVVVICSGNRFRSPIAEGVLRDASKGLPVNVASAGTLDTRPGPAFPEAVEIGRSYGLDLEPHRSRRVSGLDLSGADLVLGFEQIHVATAVVDAAARREHSFVLTELVGYLSGLEPMEATNPIERARAAVEAANDERMRSGAPPPDEIADPVGGSDALFRTTAERVRALTLEVASALFGARR
jgi:low molecular weight protein-tyrosine phosphatase